MPISAHSWLSGRYKRPISSTSRGPSSVAPVSSSNPAGPIESDQIVAKFLPREFGTDEADGFFL
jgi:hypothetical protein